ncbi:Uncharacterised protein [Bergeriella denitrificans]|uniref:Uncharacterized protein n=2 Tax=Bergeriella denitrificans TaxID=494 RepID=A0A378UJK0_BERDE|nr:Uncharacterised protein [Bergeriella denitrificans]
MEYLKQIFFFFQEKEWDNLIIFIIIGAAFSLVTPYLLMLVDTIFSVPLDFLLRGIGAKDFSKEVSNYTNYYTYNFFIKFLMDVVVGLIIFWIFIGRNKKFQDAKKDLTTICQIDMLIFRVCRPSKEGMIARIKVYGLWFLFIIIMKLCITPVIISFFRKGNVLISNMLVF